MQPATFDVVIVGSGAAGGTLASHLARRGVKVAIVEGGPRVNTRTDFNTHAMPFDFPTRQIPTMRFGPAPRGGKSLAAHTVAALQTAATTGMRLADTLTARGAPPPRALARPLRASLGPQALQAH